jgi:mono/diheme cytochrome c family protein
MNQNGRICAPLKAFGRLILPALLFSLVITLPATAADDIFWTQHVEPLLTDHCGNCHNPARFKSGLDLSSLQSILRGGDHGAAVLPGRPDESNLFKYLSAASDPHMPPKKQLSEEQIGIIKAWIARLSPATAAAMTNSPATNSAVAITPPAKPRWIPPAKLAGPEVIDHFIELGWKDRHLKPAKVADDSTYLRRIYLDLAGRPPTDDEAARFLKDRRRDKRERVSDDLLASLEYPRHLREVFDVVLMGRRGAKFEDQRADNRWFEFLENSFRENRPWNELVRDLIVARPENPAARGAVWYLYERKNSAQAMAEALAPVVFGAQIKCAQCHDHMVAREIKQAHYWGMVAAFNRSKNVETPDGPALAESAIGGFISFANLKKETQPAYLTFFNGKRVEESWPKDGEKEVDAPDKYLTKIADQKNSASAPAVPRFSRRAALADAVTRDNPLLARATVNRVWAMLMGRGIVHPVDLMDSKHAPSHPDLLDWLARDFEQHGYDLKRLIKMIVSTRAYQLDSRPRDGKPAPDDAFARALEKPLSAEQLFQSLLVATGSAPDKNGKIAGQDEKSLRRAFVAQFPDLFAPDYNATLQQALFLSNSPLFDQLLAPAGGNLSARLLGQPARNERARLAIRAVFGREPDAAELTEANRYLASRSPEAGVKQLLWALVSSTEFAVNH